MASETVDCTLRGNAITLRQVLAQAENSTHLLMHNEEV